MTNVGFADPAELLSIASEALTRYKLRTFLSILGVVLGVAAVIAMMSVSEGARREVLEQVERLGLNNIVVRSRPGGEDRSSEGAGLLLSDENSLRALVPGLVSSSPLVEKYGIVSRESRALQSTIVGVAPAYQPMLQLRAGRGRLLTALDVSHPVFRCILGSALARRLFGFGDPTGEYVRVLGHHCQVVGTLATPQTQARAVNAIAWRDLDTSVIMPLPGLTGSSAEVTPMQRVDEIWLQARNGDRVEAIGARVTDALTRLHGGKRDFEVIVPRELLAQQYSTQRTFSVVVGSVAAIALLVGGIGIMNIMLTSVVERTHEIGIRRTVGATRPAIAAQFLTETLLMTLAGGTLGVALGVASTLAITAYAGWATYVSIYAIALAGCVCVGVGLIFGSYPAIKASLLEPVDALRYE